MAEYIIIIINNSKIQISDYHYQKKKINTKTEMKFLLY